MANRSRLPAILAIAFLMGPTFAHVPSSGASGHEASVTFDRTDATYYLSALGDSMRLDGSSIGSFPLGTQWQLRILDPSGAERARRDLTASAFSDSIEVQLEGGDLLGAWRGEARRFDAGAGQWVLADFAVATVLAAPPPAPPVVTAQVTEQSVLVSWTSAAAPPAIYEMEADRDGTFVDPDVHVTNTTAPSTSFLGEPFAKYGIRVRVRDRYNEWSGWTHLNATTRPPRSAVAFDREVYGLGAAGGETLAAYGRGASETPILWRLEIRDPAGTKRAEGSRTGAFVEASYTLAAGDPAGEWRAEMWARDALGVWSLWNTTTARVEKLAPPPAPTLTAHSTGRSATAAWTSGPVTGFPTYELQVLRLPARTVVIPLAARTASIFTFEGDWGQSYAVQVRTKTAYGDVGSFAEAAVAMDPYPAPDLAISRTDVWLEPEAPVQGQTFNVVATVHNLGSEIASSVTVGFYRDGAFVGTRSLGVAPGKSGVVTLPTSFATAGAHTIEVRADSPGSVVEWDETNNAATLAVTVAPPPVDLAIRAADVVVTPAVPTVGSPATIATTIRNLGTGPAGQARVTFTVDGIVLASTFVTLAAGASTTWSPTWSPATGGAHTVELHVDAGGVVEESDETNNLVSKTVSVSVAPDLSIDGTASSVTPYLGDTVTVTLRISNLGSAPSPTTQLRLAGTIGGATRTIGTASVPAIAAGASRTVSLDWVADAVGSWSLVAAADALDQAVEPNESNNQLTIPATVTIRPAPDLVVRSVTVGAGDAALTHGEATSVVVAVKNEGPYQAWAWKIRVTLRDPADPAAAPGRLIGEADLNFLQPGEETKLRFNWRVERTLAASNRSEVVAQITMDQVQLSTANDRGSALVQIRYPDLALAASSLVWLTDQSPEFGPPALPPSFTVHNDGNLMVPTFLVRYSYADVEGTLTVRDVNLAGGRSTTFEIPAMKYGEHADNPGLWPAKVHVTALTAATTGRPLYVPRVGDLYANEPLHSQGDNTALPLIIQPGMLVTIQPVRGFSNGTREAPDAYPATADDIFNWEESHANVVVEVYGNHARKYLESVPKLTGVDDKGTVRWYGLRTIEGEEGAITGARGDDTGQPTFGLNARRTYKLTMPIKGQLAPVECAWFVCDSRPESRAERTLPAKNGILRGWEYDVDVEASATGFDTKRRATLSVPILWDGFQVRPDEPFVVVPDSGVGSIVGDVVAASGAIRCRPGDFDGCADRLRGHLSVVDDKGRRLDGFTLNWIGSEQLDIRVPTGFTGWGTTVYIAVDGSFASPAIRILSRNPSFVEGASLFPSNQKIHVGGLHVLSADVTALGFAGHEINQATVRLCYNPQQVEALADAGAGAWWGPDSESAKAKIAIRSPPACPADAPSAVYRSMPVTNGTYDAPTHQVTTFSFVVKGLAAGADGKTHLRADLFNEKGEQIKGEVTYLDVKPTVGPNVGLLTPQLVSALWNRVNATKLAAQGALESNDVAYAKVSADFQQEAMGLLMGSLFDAKGAEMAKKMGKTRGDRLVMGKVAPWLQAQAADAVIGKFYETAINADASIAEGDAMPLTTDGILGVFTLANWLSIEIASRKYVASLQDGTFDDATGLSLATTRDFVYKLDTAKNVYVATLRKEARWTMPSSDCWIPMVSPPQPGASDGDSFEGSVVNCHNEAMHPITEDALHHPNLVGLFYAASEVMLNDPKIEMGRKIVGLTAIGSILISVTVPGAGVIFGPIAAVAMKTEAAIDATMTAIKTTNFLAASAAYPVGQMSIARIFELATVNPWSDTEYFPGVVSPGAETTYRLTPQPGTTSFEATLTVPAGAAVPTLAAKTPAGLPLVPTTTTDASGTIVQVSVPADGAGAATFTIHGPADGAPSPFTLSVGQELGPTVRVVRLNVTADGLGIPGLELSAIVDGQPAVALDVLSGAPEVRAVAGSVVRVQGTAPGHLALDTTFTVTQPSLFGTRSIAMTPEVRAPVAQAVTASPGAPTTASFTVTNLRATSATLRGVGVGFPPSVVASGTTITLAAGASGTLALELTPDADMLPGTFDGEILIVDAADAPLRAVAVALTVTGAFADLTTLPGAMDVVAGTTATAAFQLRNAGATTMTGIQAQILGVPWLSISGVPASLAPGASATLTLTASPPATEPASLVDATLTISSNAPLAARGIAMRVYAPSDPPLVTVRSEDADGDGVADAFVAEDRSGTLFVGYMKTAVDSMGILFGSHIVKAGAIKVLDTQTASVTHGQGLDGAISVFTSGPTTLVRTMRVLNGSLEVRLVATTPSTPTPEIQTVHVANRADLRDGVLAGTWDHGVRAPAFRMEVGAQHLKPAQIVSIHSPTATFRFAPALTARAGNLTPAVGEVILSGRVSAVFVDSIVLEDASGGARLVTGGLTALVPGDVGLATVAGQDGELRLLSFRKSRSTVPPTPPELDAAAVAAKHAANGTILASVTGTVAAKGAGVDLTTATGVVPILYQGGARVPPVAVGDRVTIRGVTAAGGSLLATPPFVRATASGATQNGWYLAPPTITASAFDATGLATSLDGAAAVPYTGPFAVATEGNHVVVATAQDIRGNVAADRLSVPVDLAPPTTTLAISGPTSGTSPQYVGSSSRVVLTPADTGSGVASTTMCIRDACSPYTGPRPVGGPDGAAPVTWWSVDRAGREEVHRTSTLTFDGTAPSVSAAFGGALWTAPDGTIYARPDSTYATVATDSASGVATRLASIDGGAPVDATTARAFNLADGAHTLVAASDDRVANHAERSYAIAIDGTAPVTTVVAAGYVHPTTAISLSADDPVRNGVASGVASTTWGYLAPDERSYTGAFALASDDGQVTFRVRSTDRLGTAEANVLRTVAVDGTAPYVRGHLEGAGVPADIDHDGWSDDAETTAGTDPAEPLSRPQVSEITRDPGFSAGGAWTFASAGAFSWAASGENAPRRASGTGVSDPGSASWRLTGCSSGTATASQTLKSAPGQPFSGFAIDVLADAKLGTVTVRLDGVKGLTAASFSKSFTAPTGTWARMAFQPSDFGISTGLPVFEPQSVTLSFTCLGAGANPADVERARIDNVRVFVGAGANAAAVNPGAGTQRIIARTVDPSVNGAASGVVRLQLWLEGQLVKEVNAANYDFTIPPCNDDRMAEVRAFDSVGNVGTTLFMVPFTKPAASTNTPQQAIVSQACLSANSAGRGGAGLVEIGAALAALAAAIALARRGVPGRRPVPA